jgi:threonine synthase
VNRLCAEIAGKYGWAFVNVNMRPYYAEGSKSMGFEIMEQLGWRIPQHTVVPMASGSLLTKIHKSYQEFSKLGLVSEAKYSMHGAQATGCSPISSRKRRAGFLQARQTEHHREVPRHRHAGGRLLRAEGDEGNRRRTPTT